MNWQRFSVKSGGKYISQ